MLTYRYRNPHYKPKMVWRPSQFIMGIPIPIKWRFRSDRGPGKGRIKIILWVNKRHPYPDSKFHGANMGPTWVLSAPDGPHVGPMNLAIRVPCPHRRAMDILPRKAAEKYHGSTSSWNDDITENCTAGWIFRVTTWFLTNQIQIMLLKSIAILLMMAPWKLQIIDEQHSLSFSSIRLDVN